MRFLKLAGAAVAGGTVMVVLPGNLMEPWRLIAALLATGTVIVLLFAPMGRRDDTDDSSC